MAVVWRKIDAKFEFAELWLLLRNRAESEQSEEEGSEGFGYHHLKS